MPRSASAFLPTVGGPPARPLTTGRSGRVAFRDEMFYVHIIPPFSAPAFFDLRQSSKLFNNLKRSVFHMLGTAVLQSGAHCGCHNLLQRSSTACRAYRPQRPAFYTCYDVRARSVHSRRLGLRVTFLNEADRSSHVFYSLHRTAVRSVCTFFCRPFDSARAVGSSPPPHAADCYSPRRLVQPSAGGEQRRAGSDSHVAPCGRSSE